MKNRICRILVLLTVLASSAYAQFPEFTRIDTGAIYESKGTPVNSSNMLFDVDNDGDLDPITSNINATGYPFKPLKLYKNERRGIYHQEQFITDSENVFSVGNHSAMGDIDNDGDIDIIGQSMGTWDLGIFFNDGYGNFLLDTILLRQEDNSSFYFTLYPVLLDLNDDGFLDIISFDSVIEAYYNDGNGRFQEKDTVGNFNQSVTKDWLHSMALGDIDNDGDMDIYCGLSRGVEKNALFINTGTSFEQRDENHITLSETAMTSSVHWVDYDNDGDMDLITTNCSPGKESGVLPALYENLGNLEFEKHNIIDEKYRGSFTISDYWGDLDNDGDQDLFITLEDGPFPFGGPYYKTFSPTTNTILYKNEGNGLFTNILDNSLTSGEAHTAKLFDHDNDGDLDVLTVGNSYDRQGHNHLFINEGNSNSFIEILCKDRYGCSTPYGTRIFVKTMINGQFVSQIRELSLIDGNVSFKYTREHFGIGDAETVDSLIIRWPSGHIDTILNVPANQFYHAIEDSILEIDFKAMNQIQLSPGFTDVEFSETGESVNIDLKDHYKLIIGDTIPHIIGDTLEFVLHSNENSDAVNATLDGSVLTLNSGSKGGSSTFQVIASAGFTQRMDQITVSSSVSTPSIQTKQSINVYPNPAKDIFHIELKDKGEYLIDISSINGQFMHSEKLQGTSHQIDLSSFQKGVYFITIRSKDFVTTEKIIKL
jgi:hypothetical protein